MEVRFVGVVLHHREMAWKGRSVPVMRSSCSSRAVGLRIILVVCGFLLAYYLILNIFCWKELSGSTVGFEHCWSDVVVVVGGGGGVAPAELRPLGSS